MTRTSSAGTVSFEPRARLLKLIGSELISDDVLAIVELVKNAHDADASRVVITFEKVTERGEGIITVADDGWGMAPDEFFGQWMEPGRSVKSDGAGRRSRSGRRALGEKGVGRFAADKLGARLEVRTRSDRAAGELVARIDWDRFTGQDDALSDIRCEFEIGRRSAGQRPGTELEISGLRIRWTERHFRRLSLRLCRLLSPFAGPDGFDIVIDSDEFPDYSGSMRSDVLERAPYRLDATLETDRTFRMTINGGRPVEISWPGARPLGCGPLRLRLFAFDLDAQALARVGVRTEVRSWLREWCGVSAYRDGFRVWPYGEPHDDWLRLDQRRVNNPTVKLSNNQIVGFLEIGADTNPELRDRTNREGLHNNAAYEDARHAVHFCLGHLEMFRKDARYPSSRGSSRPRSRPITSDPASELAKLARGKNGVPARALRGLSNEIQATLEQHRSHASRVQVEYSDLAATGQFMRDVLADLLIGTDGDGGSTDVGARQLAALATARSLVEPSPSNSKRRTVDLVREVRRAEPVLRARSGVHGITFHVDWGALETARVSLVPRHLHVALGLLASNSLEWLRGREGPEIRIQLLERRGRLVLRFRDTGPGIDPAHRDRLFEPWFSMAEGRMGMGLTLVRQVLDANGASIDLRVDGRLGPGAAFDLGFTPGTRKRHD